MKVVVYRKYGSPDVLQLEETDRPAESDDGLLVRVRAASINALDWYFLTGTPYLMRLMAGLRKPQRPVLGSDFAGTVEAVGGRVQHFRPGDEVFGGLRGTLAEYICVPEDRAAPKPANLTFEQAAAVPVAGLTALQGLRDQARVQPGQQVLINGASGGVGTFAVQIAKVLGAEVTAVCSTRSVEVARSIGADRVIDYTKEDFTRSQQRYDLIFDIAGSRRWSECRRVLHPEAKLVLAGGPRTNPWIGPLGHLLGVRLAAGGRATQFLARVNRQDLVALGALLEAGKVTPVIDRRYELTEVRAAFRHLGEGHARGKIVIAF
jgi:NADPH:quinone reductase-like Zn-dependent oxidoreductase